MTLPSSSQEWQALLDERFPSGAAVTRVLEGGSLDSRAVFLPVLMVAGMRGGWPLLVGVADNGLDMSLYIDSWQEVDRDGHYVARVSTAPIQNTQSGEFEISSWLTPFAEEQLLAVREEQREWLTQVIASAESEVELEPAEGAEADVELTLTRAKP